MSAGNGKRSYSSSKAARTNPAARGTKHARPLQRKAANTSSSPAISVVIPLYNRAALIGAAIDSVLAQEFQDFELLIVDDGSTDEGPAIVEAMEDPRVRLIRQDRNRGANAARNEGVRQARGHIVSFLDSDDYFLPNKLRIVADCFAAWPGLGLMMDSFRKTRRSGRQTDCRNPTLENREELIRALFDRRIWKSTSGISVTREAALAVGLFDEELKRRQDLDFLVRVIRAVPSLSCPDVTWVKTYTDDSISANLGGFMDAFVAFWDRHPDYYDDPVLRRGFSLDLARHALRLAKLGRWSQLRESLGVVSRRVGRVNTARALARGAAELASLNRHRRSGGDRGHRLEGR